ncbi:hypothetical protein CY35_07G031700 [Sphagnum magellanicum]|nr:hypothetical protein CY35_07G031700 [Sphagnum magellanicum]KAH9556504.1 hypothetical protein CY35_07G031700 [Sphagnum magellanicum]
MWAIGKPNAILSLSGHTSAVESVTFDSAEAIVVAGAASGTIKLWDLEEAKIVRTLTGHRSNCISVDYHPFGEFFASGSLDTNLKIWDIRRKGCIHTYKGHTRGINAIKFSPDGRWVASGGEDNIVKLWDLTAGKLMHDFKYHDGQVQCLDFHPHEFLLATGSADRTVKFFDLETFELIGSAGPETTGVRSMVFNPDGRTILSAMHDSLKIFSWEPLRCHDVVDVGWHKLADLCIHEGKLLGCSYNQSCVGVWVVDLLHVAPYQPGNPGRANNILARKFGTNGHHQPQEGQHVSTTSNKIDKVTADQTDIVEIALKNMKLNTSLKSGEIEPPQLRPSTPVSSRGASTTTSTTVSTPTPTQARRSSMTTTKLHTTSNVFRAANRSDLMIGLSPRPATELATAGHLTDESRPATSAGEKTSLRPEEHNTVENLRGDAGADSLRIDSPSHRKRGVPAKRSFDGAERSVHTSSFHQLEKLISETRVSNEGEDSSVTWNGSRSYRRSSSFEVPADHVQGRFQSYTDDMTRVQSARHTTGTEASTTGRADSGRTRALHAQWERKDRPSFSEAPRVLSSCPEIPHVSSGFPEMPSVSHTSSERSSISISGGVKTLGLDINSFVPKGISTTSEQTVSAVKHDTDIIEELMRQHHTMASIMQSRLTNMQVVRRFWIKNDARGAVEAMKKMTDQSVLVDVLSVLMERTELLTLEICCMLIPLLNGLLTSDQDRNLMTALSLLMKLINTFGPVIHTTRTSAPSLGVDLQAEQRLERCVMCYHELQTVGHCLLPLMRRGGEIASLTKELRSALERV